MNRKVKVGRNDQCPCGSGKKFKHCCESKVDWNRMLRENSPKWRDYLSVRGRNRLFLERACDALQLDKERGPKSLADLKAAFTPAAVRKIHEAIVEVWPKDIDIGSVLESSRVDVSGLYVGEYQTDLLLRGVTRHSLYANKILLVDPFIYPPSVREQYNPILHPEKFRTQTLKNIDIWFHFGPWIKAGIVEFIRTPADFDPRLKWESLHRQKKKFEENAELKALLQETAKTKVQEWEERGEAFRMLVLSAPDDYLRRIFRKLKLGTEKFGEDDLIAYVHELRKRDPYYLEPVGDAKERRSEFYITTTGASYDIAKLTASLTGSYQSLHKYMH
jgi:SEC-C motif